MIYLYTLAFIFLSLQDFYSYELMLPIVSVMGSILVIAISFSIHLIFPSSLLVRFPEKLSGLIFSMYIMPLICGLIVSSSITLNFSNGRLFLSSYYPCSSSVLITFTQLILNYSCDLSKSYCIFI